MRNTQAHNGVPLTSASSSTRVWLWFPSQRWIGFSFNQNVNCYLYFVYAWWYIHWGSRRGRRQHPSQVHCSTSCTWVVECMWEELLPNLECWKMFPVLCLREILSFHLTFKLGPGVECPSPWLIYDLFNQLEITFGTSGQLRRRCPREEKNKIMAWV